jgi:octaprenyl-diphosphate synthase
MSSVDLIKAPIKEEMDKFEPYFKSSMKSKVPLLSIITNYILRRKGKQMRPMFVFLSAKLCGDICQSTYNAASLIELLHTATLIHDDVVDESYQRRDFFSINALWKSKTAVLVGDFLLAKGLLLAVENGEYELLRIVSEAMQEMAEGELLQIEKARKLNISEDDYFKIIRKKTATLIASCAASGAKSIGAADDVVSKMKLFGENVGIAFQIKDDMFDYEQTNLIGKPVGNDIQEKKMTLPLIHVLQKADGKAKRDIMDIIKNHNKNSKKVADIIKYVKEQGGLEYSREKMQEYKTKAIDILKDFPDNPAKSSLIELVNYTTDRNK